MIRRLFADEADKVNEWVYRDSGNRVDFTGFLSDINNVCIICGEGGALFVWRGPGIFEVHVFFEQRGREVLKLSREILEVMRTEHGGKLFWAAVPITSRHVIMFTRLMGWKPQGFGDFPQGRCQLFIGE